MINRTGKGKGNFMKQKRWKTNSLILSLTILHIFLLSAWSQWSTDPTVNTSICTTSQKQNEQAIASDGAGGAIIAWRDYRDEQGIFGGDIYAQRISDIGEIQWTVNGIGVNTQINGQFRPCLVSDMSGGAIICWAKNFGGLYNYDLYAQRVNGDGFLLWPSSGVAISTASGTESFHAIASDDSGGAVITWQRLPGTPGSTDIYVQRIDSSGNIKWETNGVEVCLAAESQSNPVVVSDGAGGAIIAWTDGRSESHTDIYAQYLDATGNIQWQADGVPICTANLAQEFPVIISDGTGGAIIAWNDTRNTNGDIYSQKIDATGTVQWVSDGIPVSTADGDQTNVVMSSDGADGAILAWSDERNGSNSDVYAQRINAAGEFQWTVNGIPVSAAPNNQLAPFIIGDNKSGAIISWHDYRNDAQGDIYIQKVNPSGSTAWTVNGVPLATAVEKQLYPVMVGEENGGAIVVWEDERNGADLDIYAQYINQNGGLGYLTIPERIPNIIQNIKLYQNYPNPFNPSTTIEFNLPATNQVTLTIFNILGEEVVTLVSERLSAGTYSYQWFRVARMESGVYLYRLSVGSLSTKSGHFVAGKVGNFVETKKMILIK